MSSTLDTNLAFPSPVSKVPMARVHAAAALFSTCWGDNNMYIYIADTAAHGLSIFTGYPRARARSDSPKSSRALQRDEAQAEPLDERRRVRAESRSRARGRLWQRSRRAPNSHSESSLKGQSQELHVRFLAQEIHPWRLRDECE